MTEQMKLRDIMTQAPSCIIATESVAAAARVMRENQVGSVIVTDKEGRVCGMLTDRDIAVRVVAAGKAPSRTRVRDVCTTDPIYLSPDEEASDALRLMEMENIHRVPVVDGERPVGMVSLNDLRMLGHRPANETN